MPEKMRDQELEIYTPMSGPPQTGAVPKEIFEAMGEENIFALAESFYLRLGESEAAHLFAPTREGLIASSKKTGALLVFLFGGPPLYQKQYGPPRMRARHMPFRIDEAGRKEWMRCMTETLGEAPEKWKMPAEHVGTVVEFLDRFSLWMVNTKSEGE